MASVADVNPVVAIIIKARDEASIAVRNLAAQLGTLPGPLARIASAGGAFGILTAGAITAVSGVIALTKHFADQAIAIEKLARGTGTSVQNVQVLQETYKRFGKDVEGAGTALQFMSKAIQQHHDRLAHLGVTSRDAFTAMIQLSDVFKKGGDAAQRNALLNELLGRQWRSLSGVALDLSSTIGAVREAMIESGALMDEKMIAKAKELHEVYNVLGIRWRGVWLDIASAMVGPAKDIANTISGLIDWIHRFGKAVEDADKKSQGWWERSQNALRVKLGLQPKNEAAFWTKKEKDEAIFTGYMAALATPPGQDEGMDESNAKMLKHLALVKELSEAYPKWTRAVRDAAVASIEAAEAAAKLGELEKKMFVGPDEKGFLAEQEALRKKIQEQRFNEIERIMDERKANAERSIFPEGTATREVFSNVTRAWQTEVENMLKAGTLLHDGIGAVFQGMQQGFSAVFSNLLSRGQTFATALTTIFKTIGQMFLQMVGQIVATEVFKLFLKLIGWVVGGPAGESIVTAGTSFLSRRHGAGSAPQSGVSFDGGGALGGGNTFVFQSFSALDAFQQLTSPGAPLRQAFESVRGASRF